MTLKLKIIRKIKNIYLITKTIFVKSFRKSDFSRWKDEDNLKSNWFLRTIIMSKYIKPNSNVLEFGAGKMILKDYLPEGCRYTPSDFVDRGQGTIVCDLNAKILPNFDKYDIIFFSGVLEYINDLEKVITHLSKFCNCFIISYSILELNRKNRRLHGWVNDFNEKELIEIFKKNGNKVSKTDRWGSQKIFVLNK